MNSKASDQIDSYKKEMKNVAGDEHLEYYFNKTI